MSQCQLPSGGLNLQTFQSSEAVTKDRAHWELILDKLRSRQMPPAGLPRPSEAELKPVTEWISRSWTGRTSSFSLIRAARLLAG